MACEKKSEVEMAELIPAEVNEGTDYCKIVETTDEKMADEKEDEKEDKKDAENPYSTLKTPTDDVYSLAHAPASPPKDKGDVYKKVTFYRRLSAFLLLLCFVLLAVVVALAVTTQSSKQCPTLVDPESMSKAGVCNRQACEKILSSQPVSSNVVTACTECGKDWLKFEDSCYFLSRVRLTWQESRNECHKIGGDLVVISNERVQKFLTQKGSMLYWIGLNRSLGTEPWTWINNTSLITGYWAENLQNGNCVFLKAKMWFKKNWHLSPCTDISHYICQKA